MAIIKCHECGSEISSDAKFCPKCGAKPEKNIGAGTIILVAVFSLIMFSIIGGTNFDNSPQNSIQDAQKAADNTRYNMARLVAEKIRNNLRDPDSLAFNSMRISNDSSIVCVEYRARNGFGGMNREILVMTMELSSQSAKDWNTHCTQPLQDMLWAVD